MNRLGMLMLLACLTCSKAVAAGAGEIYLRHIFGDDTVETETSVWPNPDRWMIRGERNAAALAEIASEKISHGDSEVFWVMIENALCIVEVRDGKVDPRFLIDQIHLMHRQVVLGFLYAALQQDLDVLGRLATKPANIRFGGAKPAAMGDMDVYHDIIASLPVIRVSTADADQKSRSISYRVPLGKKGFDLRLVKRGNIWLVDSDKRLDVPLDFFFQ